jgi:hypothetical protein
VPRLFPGSFFKQRKSFSRAFSAEFCSHRLLICANGVNAKRAKGGGDAGGFAVLHGHLHEWKKVQMNCRHRESRSTSGVPRAMGYGLLRTIPGGLTDLSSAGGPSLPRRTCVGTRSRQSRQERSCDERQARRNHATSAAAYEVRYAPRAATASGPRHRNASRRAPRWAGTSRNIIIVTERVKNIV